MDDMSYFKTLTIETNALDCDSSEWNKQEVLLELNELGLSSVYSEKTGWAKYIINHVLDDIEIEEGYVDQIIHAFFESKIATELTLKVNLSPNEVGEIKIYKS